MYRWNGVWPVIDRPPSCRRSTEWRRTRNEAFVHFASKIKSHDESLGRPRVCYATLEEYCEQVFCRSEIHSSEQRLCTRGAPRGSSSRLARTNPSQICPLYGSDTRSRPVQIYAIFATVVLLYITCNLTFYCFDVIIAN